MWPFSSTGGDSASNKQPETITITSAPVQRPHHTPIPTPAEPASNPAPSSAPHDPDFYSAHPHLAPPSFSSNNTSPADHASSLSTPDDLDPHLPRSMSCRAAFDSAFYCSSLGGHFNDIYRYGQLRSCSDHWNDFWFCMRTKNSYSGQDVKERMVQERYREKEDRVKAGPNSEHVWTKRAPGEEVRGAFGRGMAELEGKT